LCAGFQAGFLCGAGTDCQSFEIEVHYDNPTKASGRLDSSGIKFFATPTRPNAMGILFTGSQVRGSTIPPALNDAFDAEACVIDAPAPIHGPGPPGAVKHPSRVP
jgi:hypothetical protein